MTRLTPAATASSPLSHDGGNCPPSIPRRFQALILYRDLMTARTVMDRLARMIRAAAPTRRAVLHPLLWRVDQLDDPRWRESSLVDAARADLVVFAGRGVMAFSPTTNRWLQSALTRKNGQPIELLALSSAEEAWSITLQQDAGVAQANPQLEEIDGAMEENALEEALAKSA